MKSLLVSSRRPDITFHSDGRIDIAAHLAKRLSLSPGDVIDIMQDGAEFYIIIRFRGDKVIGRHEAQCYPTKSRSMNYRCHSARLCRIMIHIAGAEQRLSLMAGETRVIAGIMAVTLIVAPAPLSQ